MIRLILSSLLIISGFASFAKPVSVISPDGNTRMEVDVNAQKQLQYRVFFQNSLIVNWSALGLATKSGTIGTETVLTRQTQTRINASFAWPLGERDSVQNQYQQLTLSCRSGKVSYQWVARVFNGSVAFRYEFAGTKPDVITRELTTFVLSDPYTIYQYKEETVFTPVSVDSLHTTCDFPATLTNGKRYVSIGEASNFQYTKAVVTKGTLEHSLAIGFGKDSVSIQGDFQSPWRTISVANSAIGLHAFSDLPLRLTPASKNTVAPWIKPGKLIRSSLTTQGGINCIDFAAAHDFQYILFDAGWYGAEFRSTSDPTKVIEAIDLPKVIAYGKQKGIGVILYVNRVALRARLDEILPLYKQWGVAGLKFGFVDGLTKEGLTWLSGAIQKTYDYGFVLNIHDNYKPTGLSRTYPNLLTQEGIRGNENNPDAFHNTVLPFTRFLAGAADYTFCYPNTNRYFTDNLLKSKLQVSKGQQLALSVVYFSPLQAIFWYGNPTDYNDEQDIEFFRKVPTVWNESRYLNGEIGKHITVARRRGTTWYLGSVAGLSDWTGTLSLDFLSPGKTYTATLYEDDANGSIHKRTLSVKKNDTLPLSIQAKGGVAVVLD